MPLSYRDNCKPLSFPLRRLVRTAILLLLLLPWGGVAELRAQERKVQNRPFIDERRFHYGFTIGLHDQGIDLVGNGYIDPSTGDQWVATDDRQNYGFSVGVLGEWRLNRYMALRLIPSLHFGSKHLVFNNLNTGTRETQDMKSCYVGLPLDLKVSAPRFNNYRPYVLAGIAPLYDLTTGKHSNIRTKPLNLMLEVGLGCDFYLPFFKFIPELKFCFGLGNVLEKDRSDLLDTTKLIFTESVDRATVSMVVLSFYFE